MAWSLPPGDATPTLQAFLNNFCATDFHSSPDAGGLDRTTMIQPGVYFTLDAPLVRILGLYSNRLEDPGVISSQGGTVKALTGTPPTRFSECGPSARGR